MEHQTTAIPITPGQRIAAHCDGGGGTLFETCCDRSLYMLRGGQRPLQQQDVCTQLHESHVLGQCTSTDDLRGCVPQETASDYICYIQL